MPESRTLELRSPPPNVVRWKSWPLVVYTSGRAIVGWCVWKVRTEYSDGTVVVETKSANKFGVID